MSVIPCEQNNELRKLIREYPEVLKTEAHLANPLSKHVGGHSWKLVEPHLAKRGFESRRPDFRDRREVNKVGHSESAPAFFSPGPCPDRSYWAYQSHKSYPESPLLAFRRSTSLRFSFIDRYRGRTFVPSL
jgi:hypothetical protein